MLAKSPYTPWLLCGLFLALAVPSMPVSAAKGKALKATILPRQFLRKYDPVSVVFDRPVGPSTGRAAPEGAGILKVSPWRNGAYRWVDAYTLVFRPASPWPGYDQVRVVVNKGVRSRDGGVLKAKATRTLQTLLPRPTRVKPRRGAQDVHNLKRIEMYFSQALPLRALRKALQIQTLPLPGVGRGDQIHSVPKNQWWLKRIPTQGRRFGVWILFKRPLPKSKQVNVQLRLTKSSTFRQAIPVWSTWFRTMRPFRLDALRCAKSKLTITSGRTHTPRERALNCGGGLSVPTLLLTRPLHPKTNPGLLRQMIRVSPSVPGLQLRIRGKKIAIFARYQRDTLYRLAIEGGSLPIYDEKRQRLEHRGRQVFFFYLGKQRPYLRWTRGRGIIERHGPQMMPLRSRSLRRVDLRIYAVKPTDRRYWPFPKKALLLNESTAPPQEGKRSKAPAFQFHSKLKSPWVRKFRQCRRRYCKYTRFYWRRNLGRHLRLLGAPLISRIFNLPRDPQGHGHRYGLSLAAVLKPLLPWSAKKKPGARSNQFLIGLRRLDGSIRQYTRIQVTDLSLTSVEEQDAVQFAVTSLRDASPVAGAQVLLEGPRERRSTTWRVLWRGTTNAQGLVRLSLQDAKRLKGFPMRVRVSKASDLLMLDPLQPPPTFVSRHWESSSLTWLNWTGPKVKRPLGQKFRAHLFTERPVYRPGEAVHIKGVVRALVSGKLALPRRDALPSLRLLIKGPRQERWVFDDLPLTKLGSFYRKFQPDAPTAGKYTASVIWLLNNGKSMVLRKRSFRIEAYKLPLFEVRIHAPSMVPADRPFFASLTAKFYAGGLVVSQPVKWRVTERIIDHRPAGRKGFRFASSLRYGRKAGRRSKLLLQSSKTIDGKGRARLKLDPTKSFDLRARRYTIEAVVKGPDGSTVAGYRSVKVLPPFAVGVQLKDRFRLQPGPIKAKLIAVGIKGKLVSGIDLDVRLLRREWHAHLMETDFVQGRVKYRTEVVDRPVAKCKVKTKSAAVECPVKAKKSGVYILRVQARDRMGRVQSVSLDMYIRGKERIVWERSRQQKFKLSLSKKLYKVGETAKVLVRSPFQKARALVIVEDPAKTRYQWLQIDKGQGLVEIPILSHHTPGIQLHVVLMQGRVAPPQKRKGIDPGRPQTAVSSALIPVDPKSNRILLAMKMPKRARPRQWIEIELGLRSPENKPLSGEITLWAVDRAALSLGKEGRIDPLGVFVPKRKSRLRIRDTRNLVVGRIPRVAERPGGGAGAPGGKRTLIRKNFKSVPYYNPAIQVGPSGKVKIRFRLPDDLTTFAIRAVALSGGHRFGYKQRALQVRLPVMIQRTLPRFVRPGDRLFSGGLARVVEGKGGPAQARIKLGGLKPIGATTQKLTLDKFKAIPVLFGMQMPFLLPPAVSVELHLKRLSDGQSDAFQVKIPVRSDRRREYFIREKQLASLGQALSLMSKWPEKIRKGSGRIEVLVSTNSEALRALAALDYVLEYPYGCVEQRLSRATPLLAYGDILKHHALSALPSKRIEKATQETLRHLQRNVGSNGAFGFWPNSNHSIWLTSYAASFLFEAQKQGYTFPRKLLRRSLAFLRRALRSDFGLGMSHWQLATRAEVLWTLAQAGQHEPAYIRRLFKVRRRLDLYGRSRLLLAMLKDRARHLKRVRQLTQDLQSRVMIQYEGNTPQLERIRFVRRGFWYGALLSSKTRTLAGVLEALAQAIPKDPRVVALKDALLSPQTYSRLGYGWQRDGASGSWGSTQNNARALLALRSFLKIKPKAKPLKLAYQWQAGKGKWSAPSASMGKGLWSFSHKSDAPLKMKLQLAAQKGPFWIRARLSYIPATPGSRLKPKNKGLSVQRQLTVLATKGKEARHLAIKAGASHTIAQGAVLEEKITLISGRRHHHVVVEIPIASGLTLLNPSLSTSSSQAKASKSHSLQPTHQEFLDDRVRFFFDRIPAGNHVLYFRARAILSGSFSSPPARASLMYRPQIYGRSAGSILKITRK